jgi:hypothetical protein
VPQDRKTARPQYRKTARPQDLAALFDFDVSGWWTDTWTLFYFRPNPKVSSTLYAARPQDRKTARPRCFIRFRCLRLVDRHLDTFLFSAKSKSVLRAVYRNSARPQDHTALLDTWKERDLPPAARVGRTARLIVVLCLVFFDLLEMAPPWPSEQW